MIFLFLLTSGVSVYFLAIQSQTTMMETQEVLMNLQTQKMQENYDISISTDSDNNHRLFIHAKNQGSFPLEITDFWIVNKTDSVNDYPAKRYSINYTDSFIPPGHGANILENYPLYMNPDTYDVKVISTLGTIHKQEIDVGVNNNLRAELLTIPPDVRTGENVTIALHVTNTGKTKILDVTPFAPQITPSSSVELPLPQDYPPVDLNPFESTFFNWEYSTSGPAGTQVTFLSNATGIEETTGYNVTSNDAMEKITLQVNEGTDIIVLTEDLLARPGIFTVIPGPFGDDAEDALWAVNIANPTPQPMYVNKLVFTAITTRGTGNDKIFNDQSCNPVTIPPTPTGTWSCPVVNQLMWQNLSTPALVPGFSVVPFAVRIDPGSLSGGPTDVLEAIPIQTEVHTTLGQFGKAGYGTSMDNGGSVLANVYLTDNPGSTNNNDILLNVTGIQSGSTVRINATLADFDTSGSKAIDANSRLIINVPKDWTNPTVVNAPGFTIQLPIQTYSDGSSQIVGTLNAALSGSGGVAQTIEFDVTAPTVTDPQMYVMYILGDGTANGSTLALGPLAEVVLQVVP